jgi:hypothetical protein
MKQPSIVAASAGDEHSVPSSPDEVPDEADADDNDTNRRRESGTVSPSPGDDAKIPLASTNAIVGNSALQLNNSNANLARMLESVESMMNSNDAEHNMNLLCPTRSRSVSGSQPPPMVASTASVAVNISPILSAMDLFSDANMKQPPMEVTSAFPVEATSTSAPFPDAQHSYSSYDHEVVHLDSFVSHLPGGLPSGAIPDAAYSSSATSNTTTTMLPTMATSAAAAAAAAAVMPGLEVHEALLSSKNAFPLNLTRMLESVVPMGMAHIVSWTEDEKSFVIYDVDTFLVEVLPNFFP